MLKLNLGSGYQKIPGFINVDSCKECQPDIIWDLEKTPWPFKSETVTHVLMNHSLEYLGTTTKSFFKILGELYRICAPDATIEIVVYHPSHEAFISSPINLRAITPTTFNLFDPRLNTGKNTQNCNYISGYLNKIHLEIIQIQEKLDPIFIAEVGKYSGINPENIDLLKKYFRNSVIEVYFQLAVRKINSVEESPLWSPPAQLTAFDHTSKGFSDKIHAYIYTFNGMFYNFLVYYHCLKAKSGRILSTANPNNAEPSAKMTNTGYETQHINTLNRLLDGGHVEDALESSRQFSLKNNKSAFAQKNYGALLAKCSRIDEAIFYTRIATELDPHDAEASYNLGILHDLGHNYIDAIKYFRKSIDSNPRNPKAYHALGITLFNSSNPLDAIDCFSKGICLLENFPEAYFYRGNCFLALCDFEAAIASYDRAIFFNPHYAEAYCGKGNALFKQEKLEESTKNYDLAVIHKDNYSEAINNRAAAYISLGNYPRALLQLNRALELGIISAAAYFNRGIARFSLGEFVAAMDDYDHSAHLGWPIAEIKYHKSLLFLLTGDLESGFENYEYRKVKANPIGQRSFDKPILDKFIDIKGKSIFVYYEQGLGDTILFCRYLILMIQRGAKVIFEPQRQLAKLVSTMTASLEIALDSSANREFDYHTSLMSLPYIFGTSLETIPSFNHYLLASEDKVLYWRNKLRSDGFKVAVAWQCSQRIEAVGRSFPISMFKKIGMIPGVRLISIQKDIVQTPHDPSPEEIGIEILSHDLDSGDDSFVDTAAIIVNCDLVITCDTSVAHLAGALGAPVWVVLKNVPHWVWLTSTVDSPWYPSMKLFRQNKPDDWQSVFSAVYEQLDQLIAKPTS